MILTLWAIQDLTMLDTRKDFYTVDASFLLTNINLRSSKAFTIVILRM